MKLLSSFCVLTSLLGTSLCMISEPDQFIANKDKVVNVQTFEEIPDNYIVILKKNINSYKAQAHQVWLQTLNEDASFISRLELKKRSQIPFMEPMNIVKHTFNIGDGYRGYAGHFSEEIIREIREHPDVEYVEKDTKVYIMSAIPDRFRTNYNDDDEIEDNDKSVIVERDAPWGLARISHRHILNFGNYNKYIYTQNAGEGVDVYVIDTGINTEHQDFQGRAVWGKTIPVGDTSKDENGHGTHCSGTIAGKDFGVAKQSRVIAVKVLRSDGAGSMSDVVKGVEYAAEQHMINVELARTGKRKGFKGSAANMSLGGGKSYALDMAVNAAVEAGLHFAVAAGNSDADSCYFSPASAEKAITVGATTMRDERAYFSNYGRCNDIFAPGYQILSAWIGSPNATNIISGTSMASPHVAGLLAYLLSLQPSLDSGYSTKPLSPSQLKDALMTIATHDVISDVPIDTKNILAWNGGGRSDYRRIVYPERS